MYLNRIDFNALDIKTKDDFLDYFLYYYEYSFLSEEVEVLNIRTVFKGYMEECEKDLDFDRLWIYLILKYQMYIIVSEHYSCQYLKETIIKILSDIELIPLEILEDQIEVLEEASRNISVPILEARPYEQIKFGNTSFFKTMNLYESKFIQLFEKYEKHFSEKKSNELKYFKIKDLKKFINETQVIFEFWSTDFYYFLCKINNEKETHKLVDEFSRDFISDYYKISKMKQIEFNSFISELTTIEVDFLNKLSKK